MATRHKSAVKRAGQNVKRNIRNSAYKSKLRTITKKTVTAVAGKNKEQALAALKEAIPVLDRAATKKIFHPKTASRKVSRLQKMVNSLVSWSYKTETGAPF